MARTSNATVRQPPIVLKKSIPRFHRLIFSTNNAGRSSFLNGSICGVSVHAQIRLVRYLGIEVDDALEMSEQIDL